MVWSFRLFAICSVFAVSIVLARAEAATNGPLELRLGVLSHDPGGPESGTADLAGDVLIALPGPRHWAMPRLQIGGILNLAGRTNVAHAGLSWQFPITNRVFIETGLGLAVHDGATGRASAHGQSAMGCRYAFRETLGLGYRLGSGWNVVASVEHLSNGGLCARNRGLTHAGLRMGYAF
jgi:lipid A 3-O-deacylase